MLLQKGFFYFPVKHLVCDSRKQDTEPWVLIPFGILAPLHTAQTPAVNSNSRCMTQQISMPLKESDPLSVLGLFDQILPIISHIPFEMLSPQAPGKRRLQRLCKFSSLPYCSLVKA